MLCVVYQLQKMNTKLESIKIENCQESKLSVEGWMDGHMRKRRPSYYIYIIVANKT